MIQMSCTGTTRALSRAGLLARQSRRGDGSVGRILEHRTMREVTSLWGQPIERRRTSSGSRPPDALVPSRRRTGPAAARIVGNLNSPTPQAEKMSLTPVASSSTSNQVAHVQPNKTHPTLAPSEPAVMRGYAPVRGVPDGCVKKLTQISCRHSIVAR